LLRFYRFHACIGRGAADAAGRAACRALAPLVATLSGERVQAELLKLLRAPDPGPTLALMTEDGVLQKIIASPRALDPLRRLIRIERAQDLAPDPLRRLAALVASDAEGLARRLRLSNADRNRLIGLGVPLDLSGDAAAHRRQLYGLGRAVFVDRMLVTAAISGATRKVKPLLAIAARWRDVAFPLRGQDLTEIGIAPGPEIGRWLQEIEAWWEDGDFKASRRACLAELHRRLAAAA